MPAAETGPADTMPDRAPPIIVLATPFFGLEAVASPDFAGSTIIDPTDGAIDTLTIHVGNATVNGGDHGVVGATITGDGLTRVDASTYTLTGTASQITSELDALLVTPTRVSTNVLTPVSTPLTFTVESDVVGSAPVYASKMVLLYEAPCYAAGTRIATTQGGLPVEDIQAGDIAILATGGTAPIVWIGHRRVRNADPVRIVAGAFGPEMPARDLVLSPEHALFLDGHLVPVHLLVDGVSVIQEPRESITYYHVELNRHAVLLAEGLPAESYLDTGNRNSFGNSPVVRLAADFEVGTYPAETCAPIALTGAVVETQRARLRDGAAERISAAA